MNNIVVGKRITVGAAINGVAAAAAALNPESAVTIMALTIPITFIVQLIVVNRFGITTKE